MMRHSSIVHFERGGIPNSKKLEKRILVRIFEQKGREKEKQRDRENSGNGTDKGIVFRGAESDRARFLPLRRCGATVLEFSNINGVSKIRKDSEILIILIH